MPQTEGEWYLEGDEGNIRSTNGDVVVSVGWTGYGGEACQGEIYNPCDRALLVEAKNLLKHLVSCVLIDQHPRDYVAMNAMFNRLEQAGVVFSDL